MRSLSTKIAIFLGVVVLVTAAVRHEWKASKKVVEHRTVPRGEQSTEKGDDAALFARATDQVNPTSAGSSKFMGDLAENAGSPAALEWRIRAAKLDPKNMQLRFQWAETAIKLHDISSAKEALDGLDEESRNSATYHKLKGALAWSARNVEAAGREYSEAKKLEPDNPAIDLNLATIHLTSTNASVAKAARAVLERFTTNNTFRLSALRLLLRDAVARKSAPDATDCLRHIIQDPSASLADKIEYLELLRTTTNADYGVYLASLEAAATNSPQYAFAVGRWKAANDPTNALHWLQGLPSQIQTNQPVPLVITDCQVILKDWNSILALVTNQNWGDLDFYRFALKALAERSLEKKTAADASWHESLRASAHRLDRLSRLAQITGSWGWTPEKAEVLRELVDEFPADSRAVDQLAGQLYAAGKTDEMEALYLKVYSRDPSDPRIKSNLATTYMLRKTELPKAFQLAREAYDSATNNPFFASTYAYSLLLQDRKDEALEIVDSLKSEYLQIPSIALYYGVVQAGAGHKQKAEEALTRAESAKLLPEERKIVQMAKASL